MPLPRFFNLIRPTGLGVGRGNKPLALPYLPPITDVKGYGQLAMRSPFRIAGTDNIVGLTLPQKGVLGFGNQPTQTPTLSPLTQRNGGS